MMSVAKSNHRMLWKHLSNKRGCFLLSLLLLLLFRVLTCALQPFKQISNSVPLFLEGNKFSLVCSRLSWLLALKFP